jgi:catechol 2,3-dioxygenase-like lactoylglutathione lyase family enzyme
VLKLILIITLGVPDVSVTEQAYTQWLSYEVAERGAVGRDLAGAWNAPRMAGHKYSLLKPQSKANIYLRFVQVNAVDGYVPMKTFGWNAIEMLVQDPDLLAEKLGQPGSPFQIVGVPRSLGPNSPIRAMQVVGPAKEVLYLTRIPPGSSNGMGSATTPVDRPFIMIVGGPDLEQMRSFYAQKLGLNVSGSATARMTVLNKAHGLDIETTHPLSMARVSPQYSLEIDGYPPSATARPVRRGELPPAVAMVGFEVDSLDHADLPLLARPRIIKASPYLGRRIAVTRGAGGELIELIEAAR